MTHVNNRFLCWNNWLFEAVDNLERQIHRPVKHPANPLFADALAWANVIRDPATGLLRMWYNTRRALPEFAHNEPFYVLRLAYAESRDGLYWERPELNILPDITPPNNFTDALVTEGAYVYQDRHDPIPGQRYKLLYVPLNTTQSPELGVGPINQDTNAYATRGLSMAVSPDGLRWRRAPQPRVLPHNSDSHNTMVYDEQHEHYLAYCRAALGDRRIAVCMSKNLADWTGPFIVLEPEEIQTQFYGLVPMPLHGGYAGLINVFKTEPYDPARGHMQGICNTELAYSNDGVGWHRVTPGTPWLNRGGTPDDFDRGMIFPMAMLETDDRIMIYYQGISVTHAEVKKERSECALGLATLRRDGFVSLNAGETEGALTTRHTASYSLAEKTRSWRGKLQWTDFRDGQLYVNAVTQSDGYVAAELLDERWQVIPGYTREDCIPFSGDSAREPVRWKARATIENPKRTLSIRLFLKKAKLYSFWME